VDGRQRAGRLRPRSLDWVIAAPRLRLGRRGAVPPPSPGGPTFREWLASFWTPGLRVLEVCDRTPALVFDAVQYGAADYVCLTPPGAGRNEEVGRLGWSLVEGDPKALARCRARFDLVAWLRDEESVAALFAAADRLLTPNGVLAARTTKRLDARLGSRWLLGEVVALADGGRGVAARKRRRAQAA
jgi:hypothetical protein